MTNPFSPPPAPSKGGYAQVVPSKGGYVHIVPSKVRYAQVPPSKGGYVHIVPLWRGQGEVIFASFALSLRPLR